MAINELTLPHRHKPALRGVPIWPAVTGALVCGAPLIAVIGLAIFGTWTDYLVHIAQTRLMSYVLNTLIVGGLAALTAGFGGAVAAWCIARYRFPGRTGLEWGLALPLAMPAYGAAYAWYDLTQAGGPLGFLPTLNGPIGAGLVFGFTLYPYVYLLARETFSGQSVDAYEAARTLGCSPLGAFWRAALPMARPAIAAGLALVIMESLADYGAVVHLGAPTLSVGLMRAWAGEGSTPDAARIALLLVSITFIIFAFERQQRARARMTNPAGHTRPARPITLNGLKAWLVSALCALPLVLALILPLGRFGWRALHTPTHTHLVDSALNSLMLAGLAGLIAAAFGLAAAYALRSKKPLAVFAARLAGLGYAVPGAVAAVGVMIILSGVQMGLDGFWRLNTGSPFPLLLTSGVLALLFAYLSRFAAAAIGPSESALSRVTPSLDGAARTLGARPLDVVRKIHWPLISSGTILSGLLVFVEVLKELPATMILRPFNFQTLAITAHNYASDERLGEAALPSLCLVLLALIPMIWIARTMVARHKSPSGLDNSGRVQS